MSSGKEADRSLRADALMHKVINQNDFCSELPAEARSVDEALTEYTNSLQWKRMEKLVEVKIVFPGGTLRVASLSFDFKALTMCFTRNGQRRHYPVTNLKKVTTDVETIAHLKTIGVIADMLVIEDKHFVILYLSDAREPMVLIFPNVDDYELFISTAKGCLAYIEEVRVMQQKIRETVWNALEEKDMGGADNRFMAGVPCSIASGSAIKHNCELLVKYEVGYFFVVHPDASLYSFPVASIVRLSTEKPKMVDLIAPEIGPMDPGFIFTTSTNRDVDRKITMAGPLMAVPRNRKVKKETPIVSHSGRHQLLEMKLTSSPEQTDVTTLEIKPEMLSILIQVKELDKPFLIIFGEPAHVNEFNTLLRAAMRAKELPDPQV